MTEKKYRTYVCVEFESSDGHHENLKDLMYLLNDNGFIVKDLWSFESDERTVVIKSDLK